MDAAYDIERNCNSGPFGSGLLRLALPLIVLASTSHLDARSPENARPISPPKVPLNADDNTSDKPLNGRSIGTTAAALGAILLLFVGLVQIWRRYTPQTSRTLPAAAWEVLGTAPLDNGHQIMIVRLGRRLLVLGRSEAGLQTLSEVTSGEEVSQLVALCETPSQATDKNTFRQLYENFRSQLGTSATGSTDSQSSMNGETRRA